MQQVKQEQKDSKQIAIVGHSHYFTYLTASQWNINSEGKIDSTKGPKKSIFLNNCEFVEFDRFLPALQTVVIETPVE